ncbi:MAG TPA: hypothetical protein VK662_13650 [Acidothermaceae bacterium]|nr:hypothetical protein [Acidothermaceae bacterium]
MADTLEIGREPRRPSRWLRPAVYVVALAVVVALVLVSIQRSANRRHERASFDRMLTLSAAAQAAVERAVSQERDVAQYAEPLLNSSLTSAGVRDNLYVTVSASAKQSQSDIDSQLQQLKADPTGRSGRLRAAKDATIAYLSDWSALFASAAGSSSGASGSNVNPANDPDTARLAAQTALEKAAPDQVRAAKASAVFGTTSG